MKKKTKHWLFGVLSVIVVGLAGLNLLAYNHAHAMMCFATGGSQTSKPEKLTWGQKARVLLMGVNVPRPRSDLQPSALDPECRRLSIRCPDGVTLGCWYVDHGEKTPLALVIVLGCRWMFGTEDARYYCRGPVGQGIDGGAS